MGILSIVDDVKLLEKVSKETNDKEQIILLFSTIKFTLEKVVLLLKENEIKQ